MSETIKKYWLKYKIYIGALVMAGFWGFLYPEYTLLPDTYRIVYEDEDGEEQSKEDEDIYSLLQKASPKQIKFRSRLWEFFLSLRQ